VPRPPSGSGARGAAISAPAGPATTAAAAQDGVGSPFFDLDQYFLLIYFKKSVFANAEYSSEILAG